jgi:hypothetical protein
MYNHSYFFRILFCRSKVLKIYICNYSFFLVEVKIIMLTWSINTKRAVRHNGRPSRVLQSNYAIGPYDHFNKITRLPCPLYSYLNIKYCPKPKFSNNIWSQPFVTQRPLLINEDQPTYGQPPHITSLP